MIARIPLVLDPQPEGGYTVTSPLLPELITEGHTILECLINAEDAFAVVLEIYEDEGRPLPPEIHVDDANGPVSVEAVVAVPAP
jgi:antitoxin HicB